MLLKLNRAIRNIGTLLHKNIVGCCERGKTEMVRECYEDGEGEDTKKRSAVEGPEKESRW